MKKTQKKAAKKVVKKQPAKKSAPRKPTPKPKKPVPVVKPPVKPPVLIKPPLFAPKTPGGRPIVVPSKRISQNGETRPTPTYLDGRPKITYRVWKLADEISATKGIKAKADGTTPQPATRQEVLTACAAENIPYSVFSNQFYRWRKFNGVTNRVRKDGSLVICRGGPRKYREEQPEPPRFPVATRTAVKPKPPIPAAKPLFPPAKVVKPAPKPAALPFPVPAVASAVKPAAAATKRS